MFFVFFPWGVWKRRTVALGRLWVVSVAAAPVERFGPTGRVSARRLRCLQRGGRPPARAGAERDHFLSSSVEGRSIPGQFRASFKTETQGKLSQSLSFYRVWAASRCADRIKSFHKRPELGQQKKEIQEGVPPYTTIYSVWAASCRAVWISSGPGTA